MKGKQVSQSECAAFFGVHRNTVANWLKKGCPFDQKANKPSGKDWVLNTADVAQWRESQAVLNAIGDITTLDIDELKQRKLAAETVLAEVEAAKAKNKVVPVDDMEKTIRELSIELSTRMMIVGKRCFPNDAVNRNLVDEEVRQVLCDAVNIEIDVN